MNTSDAIQALNSGSYNSNAFRYEFANRSIVPAIEMAITALQEQTKLEKALEDRFKELKSSCVADDTETYTTGYRNGHKNGQLELIEWVLKKPSEFVQQAKAALTGPDEVTHGNDTNYIEGICCDCGNDTRGFCGDYSENEHCTLKRNDGSCWTKPQPKEANHAK